MARTNLTRIEAVKSWVLRASGWRLRDIQARFGVDPRRLYEVWEESEHKGTRFEAMRLFARLFPSKSLENLFEKHKPRYKRTLKNFDEPRLPGI